MEFEWDEAKRLRNLEKHDIDFVDAQVMFDGRPEVTVPSAYPDEARYLTTVIIDDRLVTVIWTRRSGSIRLISARRARDGEQRAYRQLHGG